MKKSILGLEGVVVLSKTEKKVIKGQMLTWCRRQSTNLIDIRPGAPAHSGMQEGYQNSYGCWIYPGMDPLSHPGCGPSKPTYSIFHGQGVSC